MRALLRPALLLLDDELFLAFGGFEQGAAAGHVPELGIRHLFHWL